MKGSNLYNPPMKWLLRSPLHFFVSGMYMVVTFTGRKSGKTYSTPVEYFYDGETLTFLTARERLWWKNLRDGAAVTVQVKSKSLTGTSRTSVDDPAVYERAVRAYLRRYPGREKYFGIRTENGGAFNAEDLAREAAKTVVVGITTSPAS